MLWNEIVEILRESIFAYAQICNGSLGAGILVVTFLARLALLPVGIRVARAAAQHQEAMARLQPNLDALRTRHRNNPKRLAEETRSLLAREGLSPFSSLGCLGTFAQFPVFIALYSSVRQAAAVGGRFLWVRDLARPDWIVVTIATGLTLPRQRLGGRPIAESHVDAERVGSRHGRGAVKDGRRYRSVLGTLEPLQRRTGVDGSTTSAPRGLTIGCTCARCLTPPSTHE